MGAAGCSICADKVLERAVDEELHRPGRTFTGIARLMTARGFRMSAPTISNHNKHKYDPDDDNPNLTIQNPPHPPRVDPPVVTKRDATVYLRDRMLDQIEAQAGETYDDGRPKLDLLDKDLQPALKTVLTAQRDLDKRESKTSKHDFMLALALQLGATPVPDHLQIEDGSTIEGDFAEVPDGDD